MAAALAADPAMSWVRAAARYSVARAVSAFVPSTSARSVGRHPPAVASLSSGFAAEGASLIVDGDCH